MGSRRYRVLEAKSGEPETAGLENVHDMWESGAVGRSFVALLVVLTQRSQAKSSWSKARLCSNAALT